MKEGKTIIAIPPGETIKEVLEIEEMAESVFAERMCMTNEQVTELISGDAVLTEDIAFKLETVLNIPAAFWRKLEGGYREKIETD